jgi:Icc protein
VAVRLAQITDLHAGAGWAVRDPLDTLREVITAIHALPDRPDGVLITGDLANDGREEEYAALAPVLAELHVPFRVLGGNHDDRAGLRRHFSVGGDGDGSDPVQYVVWWEPLRVVMLDTTITGEPGGDLDWGRLAWLESVLRADGDHVHPTLLAMHHPPFPCGVRDMDRIGLAPDARAALAQLIARHPQVVGCVAGHHHRTIASAVAGRPALAAPSTYCQLPLDFDAPSLSMVPEPVGFAVHTLVDGGLVSHVQTLASTGDRRDR